PAQADVLGFLSGLVKPQSAAPASDAATASAPAPAASNDDIDDAEADTDAALGEVEAPAADAVADTVPTVEKGAHRMSCVPYARERSGLQIFGDAKYWWDRAADLYARVTAPVADAVMVFSGSSRIRRGHVAVVTAVLSPREIKVDHANWQNHGEIDLNMPVLDVSKNNDWSQVRVWDPRTGQFGARVYAISGFITRTAPTTRGS
ncbi:MAG TPA: CHAP domain-containing protein, partial [Rhizomicrobium sp.]|nr:CHAP domain-containing protein [Rhizomicrobium sp.]